MASQRLTTMNPTMEAAQKARARLAKARETARVLKEQMKEEKQSIERLHWEAIQQFAKNGDIAIDRRIAQELLQNCEPEMGEDLEAYVTLCEMYDKIQKGFATFYASDTFKEICEKIAEGWRPHRWNPGKIRPADSDYRPRRYRHLASTSSAITAVEDIIK